MSQPGEPRRRPPWWPAEEQWPPERWGPGQWHRGRWTAGRRRRPFGCAFLVLGILLAGTFTLGVWAVSAVVGLLSAPTWVVAFGLVALVVIGIAAGGAIGRVRRMTAPIDDLADAAEQIERGDYSTRVDESGPPAVRSLARAFNQMSARLETVDATRRAFLADVAHELRTPLTVISGQLEAIELGLYPADAEHLAPIRAQVQALDRLIDDVRTLALAESGGLALDRQPTDLAALADESVAAFAPQAQASGVALAVEATDRLPRVAVDAARVRQVLANLIANSLRHTPAGGRVTIAVGEAPDGRSLRVSVTDTGSGIPAELLPTVLERFAKGPDSPGSGLGLAIARDLVEAHGGTITVSSEPGRGATIAFTLPI